MFLIKIAILTLLMAILTPLFMVLSASQSEKNYKIGKLCWKISQITGFIYSVSFWITTIGLACKIIELIF